MVFFIYGPTSTLSDWSETGLPEPLPESSVHYKVMITGDSASGKTSLITRFRDKTFAADSHATIGVDHSRYTLYTPGQRVELRIWDAGGEERFQSIVRHYYSGRDAILICFNLNESSALLRVPQWMNEIQPDHDGTYPSIILVGTQANPESQMISNDQIVDAIRHWNDSHLDRQIDGYIETNAKTGMNVDLLFQKIAQTCWMKQQTKSLLPAGVAAFIKQDISARLERYIADTNQKRDLHGRFEHDFLFFSSSRAYNREIDYQIALHLKKELNGPHDLCSIFQPWFLDRLRHQAISNHSVLRRGNPGFFSLPHDIGRGRLGILWNDSVDLINRNLTQLS